MLQIKDQESKEKAMRYAHFLRFSARQAAASTATGTGVQEAC
jgi:hypothetical protein